MNLSRRIHRVLAAGCVALASWFSVAAPAAQNDPAAMLTQADRIKTSDNARFAEILRRLDADPTSLSRTQQDLLQYFHGWESAFQNDNEAAIRTWRAVAAHASDPDLRLRATGSLINVLVNVTRYEEAYELQDGLIVALPDVRDRKTRLRILVNAGLLYANAGQGDLALHYADQMLAEADGDFSACQAQYLRMLVFSKMHGNAFEANYPVALSSCAKANEPLYTDSIRVFAAERDLDQNHPDAARAALEPYLAEARTTGYQDLMDEMEATLARAAWMQGDGKDARAHALRVTHAGSKLDTQSVAYKVLSEVAKSAGDTAAALAWYEKYATADKGYLNDVSARAIAYQMVHQQVQEKKAQVAALSQQNQVLKLKQAVSRKDMIAAELGVALLLVVLGSIALYAYRTKRSQLKFQKLARRDGLTEIYNRQYFVELAEQELVYCRNSVRDVSVVAIDLDHFKEINDTHGHAAGDFALKRAVAACQQHLRSVDIFGRLGGEEFGILMPDCVPERARDIAEAMRAEIAALHATESGPNFPVSASFGVTAARWSGYDLLQLLAQADSALYQAKRDGRNRVVAVAGPPAANSEPPPGVADRRKA